MTPRRAIVITGASGGLGSALVDALNKLGTFDIIATGRDDGRLTELKVRERVKADLTTEAGRSTLVAAVSDVFGGTLDALVHCIGMAQHVSLAQLSSRSWQAVHDVTSTAPSLTTQTLLPFLSRATAPQVIFVGSVLTQEVMRYGGAYAAAKRSLSAYAKQLALEHGHLLRVTEIHPGAVETKFLDQTTDGEAMAWFQARRLQRLSRETVARVIAFCLALEDQNCAIESIVVVPHGQHSRGGTLGSR